MLCVGVSRGLACDVYTNFLFLDFFLTRWRALDSLLLNAISELTQHDHDSIRQPRAAHRASVVPAQFTFDDTRTIYLKFARRPEAC